VIDTRHYQALQRLTPAEANDRAFRIKCASQASFLHQDLLVSEHISPEEVCAEQGVEMRDERGVSLTTVIESLVGTANEGGQSALGRQHSHAKADE